jgi:hypothetical protein
MEFYQLRVRGDELHPGDYIYHFKATAVRVANDYGTIRIVLHEPLANGSDHVSVTADRTLQISRPVYISPHED